MLKILPLTGIGEIQELQEKEGKTDLAEVILSAIDSAINSAENNLELALEDYDVVAITQKIVSKAEGRVEVVSDTEEAGLAKMKLIKKESKRILRQRGDLIISETSHGFICANAGVDFSNLKAGTASLLPLDPDRSAQKILKRLEKQTKKKLAVIITDTFGRPWRRGLTNVAIGSAGIKPIIDLRGETDSLGQELLVTQMAIVDELAGASELVMGKSDGIPVAIIKGVKKDWFEDGVEGEVGSSSVKKDLLRPPEEDLFR